MPFPPLVDLTLGALGQAATPRASWAGLLYELLRYTGHSSGRTFGTAALADTGTEAGEVVLLDANGKVPAALVPDPVAGASGVIDGARQIDGAGAGLSDADIVVAYPDGGRLELAMKLSRAKLGQLVPRVPLPGEEAPGPVISGLPAAATVQVGAALTVGYHVSDPAAAVTVVSGDDAVATAVKTDDSGSARTLTATGVAAGPVTVTVEARNAAGTTRTTLALTVSAGAAAPVLSGLRATVTVAVGRTTEVPFHVSDPDATVEVATSDAAKATARILGAGTSRILEVTGVQSGFAALTVSARNDAGDASPAETRATVTAAQTTPTDQPDAPTVSDLPSEVRVSVGEERVVRFSVAPEDATVNVTTSDGTRFSTRKIDDAGTARSAGVTGTGVGDGTLTVTVSTADGQQSYQVPVAVSLAPTAPAILNLVTSRTLYLGSANRVDLDFSVTDPDAVVTVSVDGTEVAAALPDNSGADRTLRLTGVSAGARTVTVTARNSSGSSSKTVAATALGAPVISGLPLGVQVYAGGSVTVGYNLSDGAAVTRVSSSAAATATVAKADDAGAGRSVRVSGVVAGAANVVIEATNPSGTNRATVPVGVTGPPVVSGLSPAVSVAEDSVVTLGYRVSDSAATVRATSSDNRRATVAKVDDTGTQRSVRVSGQSPGRVTVTIEATNPAGAGRAQTTVTVDESESETGDPITSDDVPYA